VKRSSSGGAEDSGARLPRGRIKRVGPALLESGAGKVRKRGVTDGGGGRSASGRSSSEAGKTVGCVALRGQLVIPPSKRKGRKDREKRARRVGAGCRTGGNGGA
jgi:hypothetical protein